MVRLARYQSVLQQALDRSEIDWVALYGTDADLLGHETLLACAKSVREACEGRVLQEVHEKMEERGVPALLNRLDRSIASCKAEQEAKEAEEEQDQASAQRALQAAQLPEGWTVEGMVLWERQKRLLEEKESMMGQMEQLQVEVERMEAEQVQQRVQIQEALQKLEQQGKQLEASADAMIVN